MLHLQITETITGEEIEWRKKREEKKIGDVAEQIKEIERKKDNEPINLYNIPLLKPIVIPFSVPIPVPVLSLGTNSKIQISLIQAKEALHSEILLPPKLRLHSVLRFVLLKPVMAQVLDAETVKPPMLSLGGYRFNLLIPLLLKSSIKESYPCRTPVIKIIPSGLKPPILESVNIDSTSIPETETISKEDEVTEETSRGSKEEDFFEIMFQGKGLKGIEDGKPAVICVEDREGESIVGVIETMCARLYREGKGGKPEPIIFTDIEEFKKNIQWIEAENKITVIKLSENDWEKLTKEYGMDWERFNNRLEQLFSQDFGFIILNTKIQRLLERHRINVISVVPKQLTIEMKRRLAEIAWGFVKIDKKLEYMDEIFEDGRDKFEHSLMKIQKQSDGRFVYATKTHKEESNEHLRIKWFLVKYLVRHLIQKGELPENPTLSQIKSKVETEVENRFPNAIPDVISGNDVYEVETLFSEDREGQIAGNKITYTIQ